jgi:capsular polysaccharide transport system permease protein
LAAVQAQRGDLSPEQTAATVYQLISQLELQRAEAQRERDALLDQGLTNSPLLPRLNARVSELNAQVAEQKRRLASPSGASLQSTLTQFEGASSRKDIAQARWQSTLNTLQQAYLRILEQRRYFVIIVGMSAATFPAVRDVIGIAVPILILITLIYATLFALRAGGVALPGSRRLRSEF